MKVTREEAETQTRGRVRATLYVYGPTFLSDRGLDHPRGPGECSLFARRYRVIQMPSGECLVRAARDTRSFASEQAMVEWIKQHKAMEVAHLDENPPPEDVPADILAQLEAAVSA